MPHTDHAANSPGAVPSRLRLWLGAALLALILGAAFQGDRGLWDPSEGFYTNAAAGMLASGDWWTPRLNGEPFLDKPPVVYWSIGAGMKLLGVNEWGARLALIFWYAGTALLVGVLAQEFWGDRYGPLATMVYAATLLPFVAASTLTTDPLLAFWTAATFYAFWRMDAAVSRTRGSLWALALGVAIGFGLLTKGPAMLVFLPPLAVFLVLRRRLLKALRLPGLWLGVVLALAIGGSWYASMFATLPGALAYVLDNQVTGRLIDPKYGRNPGLRGLSTVYLPTLILGALPFCLAWPRWIERSSGRWRRLDWWRELLDRPAALLTALWFGLPLVVLATAASKLPLYALPLMAPLALVASRMLGLSIARPPLRGRTVAAFGAWLAFLLALKFVGGSWPTHHDTRATANALAAHRVAPETELIALNRVENSLIIYGYGNLRQAANSDHEIYFSPIRDLTDAVEALGLATPVVVIGSARDLDDARPLVENPARLCRQVGGGHSREYFLICP